MLRKENARKKSSNEAFDFQEYEFDAFPEKSTLNAPLWRRAVAYVLDILFFYFLFFQIFTAIYLPKIGLSLDNFSEMELYVQSTPSAYAHLIAGFVAASFVFLFYFALFERNFKTTIGKKITGLSLLSEKEITYKDVFLRNLTKTVLLVLLPIDFIGLPFYGKRFTEMGTNIRVIYRKPLFLIKRWMA